MTADWTGRECPECFAVFRVSDGEIVTQCPACDSVLDDAEDEESSELDETDTAVVEFKEEEAVSKTALEKTRHVVTPHEVLQATGLTPREWLEGIDSLIVRRCKAFSSTYNGRNNSPKQVDTARDELIQAVSAYVAFKQEFGE